MSEIPEWREPVVHKKSGNKEGIIKRITSGSFGLPKTFWLFVVLMNALIGGLFGVFGDAFAMLPLGALAIIIAVSLYWKVVSLVGGWAASTLYSGPTFWKVAARFMIILMWFGVVADIKWLIILIKS